MDWSRDVLSGPKELEWQEECVRIVILLGEERIRGGEGLLGDTHGSTIPGPFPTPRRSLQGGEWKAESQHADFTP